MNWLAESGGTDVKDLVIVGCGGFGREVVDVIDAINRDTPSWNLLGFVDDSPSEQNAHLAAAIGVGILGDIASLPSLGPEVHYVIGIGAGAARRAIHERLQQSGCSPATVVHPSATIGRDCALGPGTILCAGVRLTTNIRIGAHVHVNLNSTIGHDCVIGDFVTINPLVSVSGWVTLGQEAMLGTNSTVLQGLTLPAESALGGGACLTRSPSGPGTFVGVPARQRTN